MGIINIKITPKCAVCESELEVYMPDPAFRADKEKSISEVTPSPDGAIATQFDEVYQEGVLFVQPCQNGCQRDEIQPY